MSIFKKSSAYLQLKILSLPPLFPQHFIFIFYYFIFLVKITIYNVLGIILNFFTFTISFLSFTRIYPVDIIKSSILEIGKMKLEKVKWRAGLKPQQSDPSASPGFVATFNCLDPTWEARVKQKKGPPIRSK